MSCARTWSVTWSMATTRTAAAKDVRAKPEIDIAVLPFVKLARLVVTRAVPAIVHRRAPAHNSVQPSRSLIACAVRLQALPFHELPAEQARHAENEIGHALDQRQRDRLLGWNSEQRAEQHQATLLRAERAWNHEGGAAHGMQQAFDHDRFTEPDRVPHEGEHDQDLGDASKPPEHVHDAAEKEPAPAGVDRRELAIDGIDGAKDAPLPVAGEAVHDPLQDALPGPALRQIEAGEQDPGDRQRAGNGARQTIAKPERDQDGDAEAGEQKLSGGLNQNIDDDARGGEWARNAAEHDESRADEIAANLHQRQQRIGGLADEADEHAGREPRMPVRRKQQLPAGAGHAHGDDAHHHDGENSPADACDRVRNRIDAGPDDEADDDRDPDQPGDDAGMSDDGHAGPGSLLGPNRYGLCW